MNYLNCKVNWLINHREFKDTQTTTLTAILERVKNPAPDLIKVFGNLRSAVARKDNDTKKKIKDNIPAFTTSGIFKGSRKIDCIHEITGLIQVDLDDVDIKKKDLFKLHECVVSAFISPSGNGVKAIIAVDYTTHEDHKHAVYTVNKFITENLNVENDPAVKDITRLMYLSYDPDIYINSNVTPLKLEHRLKVEHTYVAPSDNEDIDDILKSIPPNCDYDTWLKVGMALKTAGEPLNVWENWSMRSDKYKKGDCAKRWRGFNNSIGKGTLIFIAKRNGYIQKNDIMISRFKQSDFEEKEEKKSGKTVKGFPSGFFTIDNNLLGLRDGWVTLVTGSAGQGKTTMTRQILLTCARNNIKSFMFFGEGEREKEENLLALADGAGRVAEKMYGRYVYNATDEATDNFIEKYKDSIDILDIKPIFDMPVFECIFEEMKVRVKSGTRLFIIDNLMKLVLNFSNERNELEKQKQIIFNLKNFAMITGCHIILIAHTNKSGEQTKGATEIDNTADAVMRYKRINSPEEFRPLQMSNLPNKEDITAVVITEKARDKSIYEPVYFKWAEKHNAIINVVEKQAPEEYKDLKHWSEFHGRFDDDVPTQADYDRQYSSK